MESNLRWLGAASGVLRHLFRRKQHEELATPKQDLMIVRRGLSEAFYFYCHIYAKEHGLEVVPERRVHNRRLRQRATPTIDRRQADRRREPVRSPAEDFIIVPDPRRTPRAPEPN